ncbi:MAG: hypothetical protein V7731_11970 [Amphritea sp.]
MSRTKEYFVHYTNDDGNCEYIGRFSTEKKAQMAVNSLYDKGYIDAEFEEFTVETQHLSDGVDTPRSLEIDRPGLYFIYQILES